MTYPSLPLGDLITPRPGTRNPATGGTETFTYVDLESIDRERKTISSPKVTNSKDSPSRARKVIKADDVLVALVRPNLNAVAVVPPELDNEIASTGFCVLRATERVLPKYIYFAVRSPTFINGLCGLVSGALYPAVTESQVLSQKIPVPPVEEQRRIVDLLSRAENIVRMRREAEAKAKEIIPALFLDMFGDPGTNPKAWEIKTIGDLCSYSRYGPRFPDREYLPGGAHILRTTDMDEYGAVRWWEAPKLPMELAELEKYSLRAPTLLVTRSGTIGRVALFNGSDEACIAGAYLIELGLKAGVAPEYALHFLLSEFGQNALISGARGVTQVNLNAPTIMAIRIPMPPLKIQEQFVKRTTQIQAMSDVQLKATHIARASFEGMLSRVFEQ